jgi:hypothetical protein
MKLKSPFLFFLLLLFCFTACSTMPEKYPDDFSLVLEWDTGALPPEYHYQYTIAIGPGPQGEFVYHPGYEGSAENTWITSFVVSTDNLQSLFDYLRDNDVLRKNWQKGMPLLGGQGTSIIITVFDQQYLVPSVSEVSQNERGLVEQTIEEIRSYVPAEIWVEMELKQSEYEQNYQY